MHKPLEGKTIILTGSQKTTTVTEQIQSYGGNVVVCPLIKTVELIQFNDLILLESAKTYEWLIFTSQNGVEYFCKKMNRYRMDSSHFLGKIAAVGERTAELLERNGFQVSFMPTIYSADVFVKEFPFVSGENPTCLFIRGEKAKDTLRTGLPFSITEWNVYTTVEDEKYINQLKNTIESNCNPVIIFASPSAVDCYEKFVVPTIGWHEVTIASIGHVTTKALEKHGAQVTYQPKKYTMQSVIEEIVKGEKNK
ncbi:MAG: uroporphyrinogen-III synthase [Lysinibacillus sp.]|nr:uroporphyrinogen-III synthase [Lysinibacillus sp.]